MHASFSAIITGVLAATAVALPGVSSIILFPLFSITHQTNIPQNSPTSTWGSTSPTGTPVCADSGKYTCTSVGLINLLSCTNILTGLTISIPITLKERALEERGLRARGGSSDDGDYCCTAVGLLSLSCLNVLTGATIYIPIGL